MFNLEEFLLDHNLIDSEVINNAVSKVYFIHATQCIDSSYVLAYVYNIKDFTIYDRKLRLGKYLAAVYNKLTPGEITHICEKVKAILEDTGTFKIIEGDELKESYYRAHYVPNHGTLSNSCMRYKRCQTNDYFKIYGDNAKMLIMTPKKGKRLLGRAILWEYNGTYLMDRVYSAENYIEYQFYAYARSKGYGILNKNSWVDAGKIQKWLLPDDNYRVPKELKINIQLKEECDNYPYMDSFCYLNKNRTILSTYPFEENKNFILHSTFGGIYEY